MCDRSPDGALDRYPHDNCTTRRGMTGYYLKARKRLVQEKKTMATKLEQAFANRSKVSLWRRMGMSLSQMMPTMSLRHR